jgi:hypothetical protein
MRRQIDHVTVRVRDHQAAESFYGAALRALGVGGSRLLDYHHAFDSRLRRRRLQRTNTGTPGDRVWVASGSWAECGDWRLYADSTISPRFLYASGS